VNALDSSVKSLPSSPSAAQIAATASAAASVANSVKTFVDTSCRPVQQGAGAVTTREPLGLDRPGGGMTRAALGFAAARHAGQYREIDGVPFIIHPIEVGRLLRGDGQPDHVVAAGLLHDVLEKTATGARELELEFGARVAQLVAAVSDDPSITTDEDWRTGGRKNQAKVAHYRASLAMLRRAAGPAGLVTCLDVELGRLEPRALARRRDAYDGRPSIGGGLMGNALRIEQPPVRR
jgi:HD domain